MKYIVVVYSLFIIDGVDCYVMMMMMMMKNHGKKQTHTQRSNDMKKSMFDRIVEI